MSRKACIAIGIDRADGMTPLDAAASGAEQFAAWAKNEQGYDTIVLTDSGGKEVTIHDVLKAVRQVVDQQVYDILVIYFAGHGVLLTQGSECWLLSRSPASSNEAINVFLSQERGRSSRIPHLVFISDACRSAAVDNKLRGLTPGVIFDSMNVSSDRSAVDSFYATLPGDPAVEMQLNEAVKHYEGVFTAHLLKGLRAEVPGVVARVPGQVLPVVPAQPLKPYLEREVPLVVSNRFPQYRQKPDVRVESVLPAHLAVVHQPPGGRAFQPDVTAPPQPLGPDISGEVDALAALTGRSHFETERGFSVIGERIVQATAYGYQCEVFSEAGAWHVRLIPNPDEWRPDAHLYGTLLLEFANRTGAVAAAVPGFIGTMVIDAGRITTLNYVPSDNTHRFSAYRTRRQPLEQAKARAAILTRTGTFSIPSSEAERMADLMRMDKALDPTLGIYAAYAYLQSGKLSDAFSVYQYMREDRELPIPFDVAAIASFDYRFKKQEVVGRLAPVCPMLSQGWVLLDRESELYQEIHDELRPCLLTSLWTLLDPVGVEKLRSFLSRGEAVSR